MIKTCSECGSNLEADDNSAMCEECETLENNMDGN